MPNFEIEHLRIGLALMVLATVLGLVASGHSHHYDAPNRFLRRRFFPRLSSSPDGRLVDDYDAPNRFLSRFFPRLSSSPGGRLVDESLSPPPDAIVAQSHILMISGSIVYPAGPDKKDADFPSLIGLSAMLHLNMELSSRKQQLPPTQRHLWFSDLPPQREVLFPFDLTKSHFDKVKQEPAAGRLLQSRTVFPSPLVGESRRTESLAIELLPTILENVGENDNLVLILDSHGSENGTFVLGSRSITWPDLQKALTKVKYARVLIIISSCYSGMFVNRWTDRAVHEFMMQRLSSDEGIATFIHEYKVNLSPEQTATRKQIFTNVRQYLLKFEAIPRSVVITSAGQDQSSTAALLMSALTMSLLDRSFERATIASFFDRVSQLYSAMVPENDSKMHMFDASEGNDYSKTWTIDQFFGVAPPEEGVETKPQNKEPTN